jgi:hypothetical protein
MESFHRATFELLGAQPRTSTAALVELERLSLPDHIFRVPASTRASLSAPITIQPLHSGGLLHYGVSRQKIA